MYEQDLQLVSSKAGTVLRQPGLHEDVLDKKVFMSLKKYSWLAPVTPTNRDVIFQR